MDLLNYYLTRRQYLYLRSLNSVQAASLVKRASSRWQCPVMGYILPEQVFTTEIFQKILGVHLRDLNKKQAATEKSISTALNAKSRGMN